MTVDTVSPERGAYNDELRSKSKICRPDWCGAAKKELCGNPLFHFSNSNHVGCRHFWAGAILCFSLHASLRSLLSADYKSRVISLPSSKIVIGLAKPCSCFNEDPMPLRSLIADEDPANKYARNNPFSNANLLHGGKQKGRQHQTHITYSGPSSGRRPIKGPIHLNCHPQEMQSGIKQKKRR